MSCEKRSLEAMKTELESKEALVKTVLAFPSKVDYKCMISLSSVAFSPGRLVHTNEFYVNTKSGENVLMSYTEAAKHLENEIEYLKKEIHQVESRTAVPEENNLLTKFSSEDKPAVRTPSNTVAVENIESEDENQRLHACEIREFCDDSGRITGQIVDLNSELTSASNVLKNTTSVQDGKTTGKITGPDGEVVDLDEMYSRMQEKLSATEKSTEVLNSEASFIRELASTHNPTANHSDDDLFRFLDQLEEQERTEKLESESFLSSKQWKKGFLSSQSRQKNNNVKQSPKVVMETGLLQGKCLSDIETKEATVSSFDRSGADTTQSPVGEINTDIPDSTPRRPTSKFKAARMAASLNATQNTQVSQIKTGPSKPKAFTGKVVEK